MEFQGLNDDIRQFDVKALLRKHKISVAALLETKIKIVNKAKVLANLGGWCLLDNYSYSYNRRIWVIWDAKQVSVSCLVESDQFLHCRITILETAECFLASFIYAANSTQERVTLWSDIRSIGAKFREPWIIAGDLNTTLLYDERVRNGSIVPCDVSELATLVEDIEVVDLRYTSCKLIWCNNHGDVENRLYCKLDKALVNEAWLHSYDAAEAIFLPPQNSDHNPCLIKVKPDVFLGNHIFRFCNMWLKDLSFPTIFTNAWNTAISGTHMYKVVKKLKLVKQGLKNLHRSEFENITARVQLLKGQMEHVQELVRLNSGDRPLIILERHLKEKYQCSVTTELDLLKQKTKADWLSMMDSNTTYFHARVKEKHIQARITSIHSEDGRLLTDLEEVNLNSLDFMITCLAIKWMVGNPLIWL